VRVEEKWEPVFRSQSAEGKESRAFFEFGLTQFKLDVI
jgi:hypothetical protein